MFTASIVTYHTDSAELEQCLTLLLNSNVEYIYIIDNSRNPQTQELCKKYSCVEYIESENHGYGTAHNIAIRKTISDDNHYHLVLNSDITFNPSELNKLIQYMDRFPEVGAIQPRIVNPDGTLQYTVRLLPTPLDLILRRFIPKRIMQSRRDRYELRHLSHDHIFEAPYHQGSFMLLRCEALKKVGLFDEHFFMYPEDIDLTRRIHKDYRTMYVPFITITHNHRAASYKSLKMLGIHIINMIRYFNKWGWFFDSERRAINHKTLQQK